MVPRWGMWKYLRWTLTRGEKKTLSYFRVYALRQVSRSGPVKYFAKSSYPSQIYQSNLLCALSGTVSRHSDATKFAFNQNQTHPINPLIHPINHSNRSPSPFFHPLQTMLSSTSSLLYSHLAGTAYSDSQKHQSKY